MRMKWSGSLIALIGSILLLLVSSLTAVASDIAPAESTPPPAAGTCDLSDCADELQHGQGVSALLFNRAASRFPLTFVPLQIDDSVAGIAGTKPINAEVALKEARSPKAATSANWPISYMAAGAETVAPSSAEKRQPHWSRLPIWGAEAEERGHRLPPPFGIGVTFYDAQQPVNVRDLKLGAGTGPPESAKFVTVDRPIISWQQNVSTRFDVWLFPFFNIYGVVGYTRGNTRGVVHVTGPVLGIVDRDLPLNAEFHGPTVGGGVTLAAGFKITEWRDLHAFMIADVNHTLTVLSFKNESLISETKPQATVASPRVGLRGQVTEYVYAGVWVGAMYQLIQEEVAGSVSGRSIEFIINQRAASPWNTLVGAQIEFGKRFNIVIEGGFGDRSSILTGATFRF